MEKINRTERCRGVGYYGHPYYSNADTYTESLEEIAFFVFASSTFNIPFGFTTHHGWGLYRIAFVHFCRTSVAAIFFFLLSLKGYAYCHLPPKHHRTHRKRNRGKHSFLPLLYSCEYKINVCVYRFTLHSGKYVRTGKKIAMQDCSSFVLRHD